MFFCAHLTKLVTSVRGFWSTGSILLLAIAAVIGVLLPRISWAQPGAGAGSYFLVIDHSGSMLNQIRTGSEKGRTRWDLMRDRAASFIERLPDDAYVWVVMFNARPASAAVSYKWNEEFGATLDSADSRARIIARIRGFPEPAMANGTWLRQATMMALSQAEAAGARDQDAFLTVLIYTDGVDEGHGVTPAEIARNPGSLVTAPELNAKLTQLRERHRNFQLFNVYQPLDESIRDAHVVRLRTNRVQLANPLVAPRQTLPIDLSFRDNASLGLAGRPVRLTLEAEDGAAIPLKVGGGPFSLVNGRMDVAIERAGDWPAGRDVRARLRIGFPEINGAFLVKEGGDSIALTIQGAERPAISDVRPAARSTFPVGREVSFSLTTLRDMRVEWDFGDGKSGSGTSVTHTFTEPGSRSVSVRVTDPKTSLSSSQSIPIQIVRLGIALDPFPGQVLPDQPVTLTATAEGLFERFEWNIDGRIFVGLPRTDGSAGTRITFPAPARAGPIRVAVAGDGRAGGRVETAPAELVVREVPALRVTSPASGDILGYGTTREFRAEVEGFKAQRVRFSLFDASRRPLMDPKEVDVSEIGPIRVGVVSERIPILEGQVRAGAILRVEALDSPVPLVREVPIFLQRESTRLEVSLPDGREPFINRSTPVRLSSNLPVRDIRWDFGDGSGLIQGGELARHTWTRYGDFSVRVLARDIDGQEVESPTISVKVPVRQVTAVGSVASEGKAVGTDIDRVPVNATLQLRADAQGDVRSVRWEFDGRPLPLGTETLPAAARGASTLKLIVDGTPEAGSVFLTFNFRISDPIVFWSGVALVLSVLAAFGYVLLGNRLRTTIFAVKTNGEFSPLQKPDGQLVVDPPEFRLRSTFLGVRLPSGKSGADSCGEWCVVRKRALLSLEKLDGMLVKRASQLYPNFRFGWGPNGLLRLSGSSLKRPDLEFAYALKEFRRPQSRGTSESEFTVSRRQPWRIRWLIYRAGVSAREYQTLVLYGGERSSVWVFWPEVLFFLLTLIAVALIRYLHSTFY